MTTLTEAERESLRRLCWLDSDVDPPEWAAFMDDVEPIVEAIVAARLASVEALADEWERQAEDPNDPAYKIGLFSAAGEVRAALRSDAHTEQKGAGA